MRRLSVLCLVIAASCGGGQKIGSGKPPPDTWSGKTDGPEAPGKLPMEVVEENMGPVRDKIKACAAATTYEGKVSARVTIEPSGTSSAVLETPSGNATIDQCITGALAEASFPTSERGQRFLYSFSF